MSLRLFLVCLSCFLVGSLLGVFCMALLAAHRRDDDE